MRGETRKLELEPWGAEEGFKKGGWKEQNTCLVKVEREILGMEGDKTCRASGRWGRGTGVGEGIDRTMYENVIMHTLTEKAKQSKTKTTETK